MFLERPQVFTPLWQTTSASKLSSSTEREISAASKISRMIQIKLFRSKTQFPRSVLGDEKEKHHNDQVPRVRKDPVARPENKAGQGRSWFVGTLRLSVGENSKTRYQSKDTDSNSQIAPL